MTLPSSLSKRRAVEQGAAKRRAGRKCKGLEGIVAQYWGLLRSSSPSPRRRKGGKWQEEDEEEIRVEELLGLPHLDLLIKIMAFLPLPNLFELRLVCKSWNTLLRSPALLEAWSAEASSHECWLVMVRSLPSPLFAKEFIAYSPSLNWLRLPLDSPTMSSYLGLSSVRVAAPQRAATDHLTMSYCIAAGAGGLMCFVVNGLPHHNQPPPSWAVDEAQLAPFVFDHNAYTVLVLNVLTGAVRTLPPPPKHHFVFDSTMSINVSMLANSTTNSYHVVLHYHIDLRYLEIYDSNTRSWKVGQGLTAAKCTGDVQSGDLFEIRFEYGTRSADTTLFAYSIESDAWSRVQAPAPKCAEFMPTVFKYKGRVLLVNGLKVQETTTRHDPTIKGFGVWELQSSSHGVANWVEVARTPPQFWKGFYGLVDSSNMGFEIKFMAFESLICMTGVHYTDCNYGGKYFQPLVYDLALDSWYHLPGYKGNVDFLGLFMFQPRFTAKV